MIFLEFTLPKTQINYTLLQNSKLTFQKNTKAKSIYHYTSIGGLNGILENKTLRFTNIKYMNDKDEVIAGLDSMVKVCGSSEEVRENILSDYNSSEVQTFVCCFSLEEDSLPMWNYYTKEINNQGYNIEFNDKELVESILRSNPILEGCDFAFGNVDYSKDNDSEYSVAITNEIMSSIKSSLSILLTYINKNFSGNTPASKEETFKELEKIVAESEKNKIHLPIYFYNGGTCRFEKNPSADFLYFIKRDCFRQEKEFRIVINVPNELLSKLKQERIYKFRINNGILVPYIELKFSMNVVKSITISPTVQSDLIEQSIQDFIKYCNYDIKDFSEFIKHSKIPVRF